ncbi:hypothetical protein N8Z70_02775 [Candidatus Puniceispirillum sp.]|nr:hypothetical protein [Alphaproteobacteria bacterium]MDC1293950.1 hypothetical protein [Candidatus Puniceispirillum sp.]
MVRKLNLFSVCAFWVALIFFAGIESVSSNTLEPFENGVGILCKTKGSKDNKEPLFFLFAEDRQSVSRLRFETNHIHLSKIIRTEIRANSISWLDREGFSNTRYQLNRTTLELSTNPGKRVCEAMSTKSINEKAHDYLLSSMSGNKI